MDEAAHSEAPQSGPPRDSHIPWLVYIPALLLIYLLSIGPAAWLQFAVPRSRDVINFVYAPVGYLADECPPIRDALDWYLFKIWRLGVSPRTYHVTPAPQPAGP